MLEDVDAGLQPAVDLARPVVAAGGVHRAGRHALGALVAVGHRLGAGDLDQPVEVGEVVVGDLARLVHPVPVAGDVDPLEDHLLVLDEGLPPSALAHRLGAIAIGHSALPDGAPRAPAGPAPAAREGCG